MKHVTGISLLWNNGIYTDHSSSLLLLVYFQSLFVAFLKSLNSKTGRVLLKWEIVLKLELII